MPNSLTRKPVRDGPRTPLSATWLGAPVEILRWGVWCHLKTLAPVIVGGRESFPNDKELSTTMYNVEVRYADIQK
jgi:hypothetical protein